MLFSYSAEYTVYREVIQNANDAGAHNVEIIFEEGQALSSGQVPLISSITLRNNGRPFDSNDWNRLRKIAEGNPDEQKVLPRFEWPITCCSDWILWCWIL